MGRFTIRAAGAPPLVLLAAAAAVLLWGDAARSKKAPPPPCPDARYGLTEPVLDSLGEATNGTLVVGADAVAIDGLCDPVVPSRFRGTRKATRVRVRWPGCGDVDGKVRLSGRIVDDCTRFTGRLRAGDLRRRIEALRETATRTVGASGGRVTSLDGLLTLDIPAGALPGDTPITIRRLDPDELAPPLADVGVTLAYALGPDGLAFALPVLVTLELADPPRAADGSIATEAGILVALGGDGTALELLDEQRTTVDVAGNVAAASAQLTHFSDVFHFRSAGNLVTGTPMARLTVSLDRTTLPVGTSFGAELQFVLGELVQLQGPSRVVYVDTTTDPEIEAFDGRGARIVLGEVEQERDLAQGLVFYRCVTPGAAEYRARIVVERPNFAIPEWLPVIGGRTTIASLTTEIRNVFITCTAPTTTSLPGSSTSTSTVTTSTSTSSSTSTTSTTTTSTTTSSTSTSTTTTIPCTLLDQAPPIDPVCNPQATCPPDTEGQPQVCRFSSETGDCACVPTLDACRDLDGGEGFTCGGACPSPDQLCGQLEPGAPCTCIDPCFFDTMPPEPVDECVERAACPPGKVCDLGVCRCVAGATTTTMTSTSTSTSTTTTTFPPDDCGVDDSQSPGVCGGECGDPEERCLALDGAIVCSCTTGCGLDQDGSCGGGCEVLGQVCALTADGAGCACVSDDACRERPELASYVDEGHTAPAGVCGGFCPHPDEICRTVGGGAAHECQCLVPADQPCALVADDPDHPVCAGECGFGGVCVDTGGPGEPSCTCQPLAATCRPGEDGVCGGLCPRAGEVCAADALGGDCTCTRFPCRNEGTPGGPVVCGGACPDPADVCQQPFDGGDCGCFPPIATTSTSSSTTSSTTTSTTSTTQPATPCALDTSGAVPVCGGTCPTGSSCLAFPNGTCGCVSPGALCREISEGVCGGLCPSPSQLCGVDPGDPSGECGCFVPPPCGAIDRDGRQVCFGSCGPGGPGGVGPSAFCVFDSDDGCVCATANDVCQPQGGEVCGGLCPGTDETCVVADDLPPDLFGCRCEVVE